MMVDWLKTFGLELTKPLGQGLHHCHDVLHCLSHKSWSNITQIFAEGYWSIYSDMIWHRSLPEDIETLDDASHQTTIEHKSMQKGIETQDDTCGHVALCFSAIHMVPYSSSSSNHCPFIVIILAANRYRCFFRTICRSMRVIENRAQFALEFRTMVLPRKCGQLRAAYVKRLFDRGSLWTLPEWFLCFNQVGIAFTLWTESELRCLPGQKQRYRWRFPCFWNHCTYIVAHCSCCCCSVITTSITLMISCFKRSYKRTTLDCWYLHTLLYSIWLVYPEKLWLCNPSLRALLLAELKALINSRKCVNTSVDSISTRMIWPDKCMLITCARTSMKISANASFTTLPERMQDWLVLNISFPRSSSIVSLFLSSLCVTMVFFPPSDAWKSYQSFLMMRRSIGTRMTMKSVAAVWLCRCPRWCPKWVLKQLNVKPCLVCKRLMARRGIPGKSTVAISFP